MKPRSEANHEPLAVVNGDATRAPIEIKAVVGQPVVLDASASRDPDRGQKLSYRWFQYREAGASLGEPLADVEITGADGPRATVVAAQTCRPISAHARPPCRKGVAHVILEVTDDGAPKLTPQPQGDSTCEPGALNIGAPENSLRLRLEPHNRGLHAR